MTAHDEWDELAAGYALHALEPDEELRFTEHLATCDECAALLREHELVAAQLGSLAFAEDEDVRPPDWSAIRDAVVTDPTPVASLAARREVRRPPRLLAAAAAFVALVGAGVVVWQATGSKTSSTASAISACEHRAGCTVVRLRTTSGAAPAVVLVSDNRATMVPTAMQPAPAGHTYVLWQLLRSGGPTPVESFTDTKSTSSPLVMPYADTAAFAVSLEPAGVPPSQPTHVLAIGNTPA